MINQSENLSHKEAQTTKKSQSDKPEASAFETFRTAAELADEKIRKGYDYTSTEMKKAKSQLEAMIGRNPFLSMGIALGLGWGVGRLLSKRGHRQDAMPRS